MNKFIISMGALALVAVSMGTDLTGGLVVSRVGDGSASLSGSASAVFLDKYSTAGVRDNSNTVAMPTTTIGFVNRFTNSGNATSSLQLNLSTNNQYLLLAGYDAAVGTASITGTTAAAANRVVGRVSLDGFVDTTTKLTDAFSGDNFRMVASDDGRRFWMAGNSSGSPASAGVRFANIGDSTSTQIASAPNNTRTVNIYNGQLYTGSASNSGGTFTGVNSTGTGLPTAGGQTNTLLAADAGGSPYDFLMTDANTMFVADDRTTASGGVLKYTQSGGVWSLAETINVSGITSGFAGTRSLTTDGTLLYAITTDNRIVSIDDTTNSVLTIATGDANTALRGIRYVPTQPVPEPASVAALGLGALGLIRRRRNSK